MFRSRLIKLNALCSAASCLETTLHLLRYSTQRILVLDKEHIEW